VKNYKYKYLYTFVLSKKDNLFKPKPKKISMDKRDVIYKLILSETNGKNKTVKLNRIEMQAEALNISLEDCQDVMDEFIEKSIVIINKEMIRFGEGKYTYY